jgi:hypothetical protein
MKFIKLGPDYDLNQGFTHKVVIGFADVIALTSASAYSINPSSARLAVLAASAATNPAGTIVKQCAARVTTAFAGGAGTLAITVGDGGDVARYLASSDMKTAAFYGPTLKMPLLYLVADTVDFIITAGTAMTGWTSGEMEIYLELGDINALNFPRSSLG